MSNELLNQGTKERGLRSVNESKKWNLFLSMNHPSFLAYTTYRTKLTFNIHNNKIYLIISSRILNSIHDDFKAFSGIPVIYNVCQWSSLVAVISFNYCQQLITYYCPIMLAKLISYKQIFLKFVRFWDLIDSAIDFLKNVANLSWAILFKQ